jgi:hypothetical protein
MRNSNHFTSKHNLNISSHSEIDFIDIVLNNDRKLFIDPCLIEINNSEWAKSAQIAINSYFKIFYQLYRNNSNRTLKIELFSHAHEINATKLGYGNGRNGHAKTPEGLYDLFIDLESSIKRNLNMSHPIDLKLFINEFAEDCLSDMLTNILFLHLNNFTLEQCKKYGIKTQDTNSLNNSKDYFYWDVASSSWHKYEGPCLLVNNELILLVPKVIVRRKFYYNISQYFSRVILENVQEERQVTNSEGKVIKPTKKSLKENIRNSGNTSLDYSIDYSVKKPNLLDLHHRRIPEFYHDKFLSDVILDKIVYRI